MEGGHAAVSDKQVQSHYIKILQMMDGFLSEYMVVADSPGNTGSKRKPLRSDIRAVILSGDASTKGFEHLKAVLHHVFGSLHPGWLKDVIEPAAVMAVGAAKLAQFLTSNAEGVPASVGSAENYRDEL